MATKSGADFFKEREQAYGWANEALPEVLATLRPELAGVPVRCAPIDEAALSFYRERWHAQPRPQWLGQPPDWSAEVAAYRKHLRRFEVAIWSGEILCGLGLGKASKGCEHLTMRLFEGNPAPDHPLKGGTAICLIEASFAYAGVLNCKELRLLNPLEGVIPLYLDLRFELVEEQGRVQYCVRRI